MDKCDTGPGSSCTSSLPPLVLRIFFEYPERFFVFTIQHRQNPYFFSLKVEKSTNQTIRAQIIWKRNSLVPSIFLSRENWIIKRLSNFGNLPFLNYKIYSCTKKALSNLALSFKHWSFAKLLSCFIVSVPVWGNERIYFPDLQAEIGIGKLLSYPC